MHGFTQTHNPQELLQNSLTITKLYLACGVNLDHTLIYNPALIPAHAQLSWVLTCLTIMGTMERMHSYKVTSQRVKQGNSEFEHSVILF